MNLADLTDQQFAILMHCKNTGGWIPGTDPVRLDLDVAHGMVAEGLLAFDGESFVFTARGRTLVRWGVT